MRLWLANLRRTRLLFLSDNWGHVRSVVHATKADSVTCRVHMVVTVMIVLDDNIEHKLSNRTRRLQPLLSARRTCACNGRWDSAGLHVSLAHGAVLNTNGFESGLSNSFPLSIQKETMLLRSRFT